MLKRLFELEEIKESCEKFNQDFLQQQKYIEIELENIQMK